MRSAAPAAPAGRALPAALAALAVALPQGTARADPIEDIVGRITLPGYQAYLKVLTGVDPLPNTPGTRLANRYSHGADIHLAAAWIEDEFIARGLGTTKHTFNPAYGPNVIGELPGRVRPDEVVIICAHFDTYRAANQLVAPGCDDNGSGTAAVMLAAEILSGYEFESTIRFIAFAGEEQWMVGSQAYASLCRSRGDDIIAAVNLDMILHPSFDNMNPDPDHDVDFGVNGASEWLAREVGAQLALYTPVEHETHVDPSFPSDNWSFWQYGYSAVGVIENTANEIWGGSNNSYHQITDVMTNPTFEWDFGVDVVRGSIAAVASLAVPIGEACYADCDSSTGMGVLDIFDFLCFQNRFAALDPYACDCDTTTGAGVCDIFDFLCFQNAFAAGCP